MVEIAQTTEQHGVYEVRDRDTWNQFLDEHDGPAYNHWGWGEAVSEYGHDHWRLGTWNQTTDQLEAVLPLMYVDSRLFGSQLLSPAFAERGSVVMADHADPAVGTLLHEQAASMGETLNADVVTLRGATVSETDPFTTVNQYVTFQVDIGQGAATVWEDIKDSRKRQINQADENPELEYERGRSPEDLSEYYQLYLETMRGHGSPPHSRAFFQTLWDELYPAGHFHLHLLRHENSLVNAMIDLSMGTTMYQWGVVSDYEQRELNGGSLVLWKALESAVENGYQTYEFGRTREGTGVYMFKKSFGGTKTWYDDLHAGAGTAAQPDPSDAGYQRAQEVWQRLPIPVTRIIGPHIRKRLGI